MSKYVEVEIILEEGCKIEEQEYTILITDLDGQSLNINAPEGQDDISLIKECIEDNIEELALNETKKDFDLTHVLLHKHNDFGEGFYREWYEIKDCSKWNLKEKVGYE